MLHKTIKKHDVFGQTSVFRCRYLFLPHLPIYYLCPRFRTDNNGQLHHRHLKNTSCVTILQTKIYFFNIVHKVLSLSLLPQPDRNSL